MSDINWTQNFGILAFGSAAVATLLIATDVERYRRPLIAIGCIYALLAIEVMVGVRHQTDTWQRSAVAAGLYADRREVQAAVIAMLLVATAVAGLLTLRAIARPLRGVVAVCGATLTLFAIETVSLHQVDAIFYHLVGPVKLIAIVWLALAILAVMTVRRVPVRDARPDLNAP